MGAAGSNAGAGSELRRGWALRARQGRVLQCRARTISELPRPMKRALLLLTLLITTAVAMAASNGPVAELEVGSYAELAARPNPKQLTIQPVPALAAVLLSVEKKKGAPLTQAETEAVRDKAAVIAMPPSAAKALEESRSYVDVNPARVWAEWQVLRKTLPHR